jgi:hypothetical protein
MPRLPPKIALAFNLDYLTLLLLYLHPKIAPKMLSDKSIIFLYPDFLYLFVNHNCSQFIVCESGHQIKNIFVPVH